MAGAKKKRGRGEKPSTSTSTSTPTPTSTTATTTGLVETALDRIDAIAAAVVAVAALVLYGVTACRTIYVGDSPELAMAAAVFGIPHPPGYPLFTIVSGVLVHLLPLDAALAANLVAALYAALAVGLASLLARRLGASREAAAFGAISLAAGATFWAQGTAIEVYGFDVLLALVAAHAALGAARSPRGLALFALALGAWIGHRPLNVVYAPGLVVLATAYGLALRPLVREPRVLFGLVGAVPFVWLPLRSLSDPALDVGDPETFDRFVTVVRSAPYVRHWMAGSLSLGLARVGRHLGELPVELGAAALAGAGFLAMAPPGKQRVAIGLGWIVAANLVITTGYHVLDIEPFFLPATWALAVLSPLGLDLLLDRLGTVRAARFVPLALAVALVPANLVRNDLSNHALARIAAEDTLLAAPENALVLVDGDTSIHALWYLQGVEGARPDVLVFSPGHVSGWYLDALEARHPDEPWPSRGGESTEPSRHTRAVLRAFTGHRPLFATPSVALDHYGAGGGEHDRLGSMPHGLGVELLEVGTSIEIDELATFSDDYFDETMARVLPMPPMAEVDVDSAALYLEYALSMSRTADRVAERHPDVAARLYQRVFVMFPDDLDRMVRDDVMRGLGEEIPSLDLGAHVATELAELLPRIDRPESPLLDP